MQYTGNANKFSWYILLPIIFILYLSFLFWSEIAYTQHERDRYSAVHQANIRDLKNVDGFILGGSNAAGLSASIMTQALDQQWYNLFLNGEGGNDQKYWDYIKSSTSKEGRDKVQTIVYSSSSPTRDNGFIENRNNTYIVKLLKEPGFFFTPQKSIASFMKVYLMSHKNEAISSKAVTKVGDREFNPMTCSSETLTITRNIRDTNETQLKNWVLSQLKMLNDLFRNAEIFVVIPSEYYSNNDPKRSEQNAQAVKAGILKFMSSNDAKVKLVKQPSFPSKGMLCNDGTHANPSGRVWRTNDLLDSLSVS